MISVTLGINKRVPRREVSWEVQVARPRAPVTEGAITDVSVVMPTLLVHSGVEGMGLIKESWWWSLLVQDPLANAGWMSSLCQRLI